MGSVSNGADQMLKSFRKMDQSDDGIVSEQEFIQRLDELGMGFTKQELSKLFECIDKDKSRAVSYLEFVNAIEDNTLFSPTSATASEKKENNPSTMSNDKKADNVVKQLRSQLEAKLGTLTAAHGKLKAIFNKMDSDGDGKISRKELFDRMVDIFIFVYSVGEAYPREAPYNFLSTVKWTDLTKGAVAYHIFGLFWINAFIIGVN
jgi:Ca2+-binding EF-hand superfamily protein